MPPVALLLLRLGDRVGELGVKLGLRDVALHIAHAPGERRPCLLIDPVDLEFRRGVADKALQHRVKMLTPALRGAVGEIDADQGEMGGQDSGPDEIIERRHHKALGEVSESAEDHHDASVGGLGLMARRGGDDRRHGALRLLVHPITSSNG